MKIPPNPVPGVRPLDPADIARTKPDATGGPHRPSTFRSHDTPSHSADAARTPEMRTLLVPSGWSAAHLQDGVRLQGMLRESVRQLVAASPALHATPPEARVALEEMLAQDPTVRQLITEHLTQSLT